MQNIGRVFDDSCPLPSLETWKNDIDRQNQDILNNVEPGECDISEEPCLTATQFTATHDTDVELSLEEQENLDTLIESVVDNTIRKYNLNKKQKVAFKSAIENVIKRYKGEEAEQYIGYVGGPGGTGKSQVIKAIVDFHKEMKVKHTLCKYRNCCKTYRR